jgi:site-specific DNA-adenine methylase
VMKCFNKSVFFNNKALLHNNVNRSQNNEITIKEALKQISQVFGFLLTNIRDWIHSFILFNYLILFARI